MRNIEEIIKVAEQNGYEFKYSDNRGTYEFHDHAAGEVIEVYDYPDNKQRTLDEMMDALSFLF